MNKNLIVSMFVFVFLGLTGALLAFDDQGGSGGGGDAASDAVLIDGTRSMTGPLNFTGAQSITTGASGDLTLAPGGDLVCSKDVVFQNLTINGTCSGPGCTGGGGSTDFVPASTGGTFAGPVDFDDNLTVANGKHIAGDATYLRLGNKTGTPVGVLDQEDIYIPGTLEVAESVAAAANVVTPIYYSIAGMQIISLGGDVQINGAADLDIRDDMCNKASVLCLGDGCAASTHALGAFDVQVENDLEVDGVSYFDGAVEFHSTAAGDTFNGLTAGQNMVFNPPDGKSFDVRKPITNTAAQLDIIASGISAGTKSGICNDVTDVFLDGACIQVGGAFEARVLQMRASTTFYAEVRYVNDLDWYLGATVGGQPAGLRSANISASENILTLWPEQNTDYIVLADYEDRSKSTLGPANFAPIAGGPTLIFAASNIDSDTDAFGAINHDTDSLNIRSEKGKIELQDLHNWFCQMSVDEGTDLVTATDVNVWYEFDGGSDFGNSGGQNGCTVSNGAATVTNAGTYLINVGFSTGLVSGAATTFQWGISVNDTIQGNCTNSRRVGAAGVGNHSIHCVLLLDAGDELKPEVRRIDSAAVDVEIFDMGFVVSQL